MKKIGYFLIFMVIVLLSFPLKNAYSLKTVNLIELDKSRVYLKKGKSITLEAAINSDTIGINQITWKSSNEKVATVSNYGEIKGINLGDTVISANIIVDGKEYSSMARVTVTSIDISITENKFIINDVESRINYGTYKKLDMSVEYNRCTCCKSTCTDSMYTGCKSLCTSNSGPVAKAYMNITKVNDENIINNRKGTKIHFIDVGRGDATLLEHNGHFGLIDVGLSQPYDDNNKSSSQYMKNILGNSKLDFIFITHEHSDHLGDIYNITQDYVGINTKLYFIKNAKMSLSDIENEENDLISNYKNSTEYQNWRKYCGTIVSIKNRTDNFDNLIYLTNKENYTINLGDNSFNIRVLGNDIPNDGYYIDESIDDIYSDKRILVGELTQDVSGDRVLSDENRNSLGALISYNGKNVLITGDMGEGDEYRVAMMLSKLGIRKIDVYKMGHHSSTTAAYTPLIDYIMPDNVIVSNTLDSINAHGNMNLSSMCYMQYKYDSKLFLTSNTTNGAVVYNFDKMYDGDSNKELLPNKSPLNLCKFNEENGVRVINFENSSNSTYGGTKCLYLEYGNFIVGEREIGGKKYSFNQKGTNSLNKYRAPGYTSNSDCIEIQDYLNKKYIVEFNSNGGSAVASQTIKYNGKVTKPNNPTRTGYTFKRWLLNGIEYNFNTAVTGNITLTAEWKQNEKTLKELLQGNNYNVSSNYVSKFKIGDSIATIKSKLGSNVTIETDKTIIATGAVIKKGNESYTVVIKGDLNGDGKSNSGDLLQMRKYLLEEIVLTGAYKEAGIIESVGNIKSLDLLRLRQYLLGEYTFK